MNDIVFMTSPFNSLHCFPHTPLATAVTVLPRSKGKENDPALESNSQDKKKVGGGALTFGKYNLLSCRSFPFASYEWSHLFNSHQ